VTVAKAAALHAETAMNAVIVVTAATMVVVTTAVTVVIVAGTATKVETLVVATLSLVQLHLRLRALIAQTTTTICRSDPQSQKIVERRLERVVFFLAY
jgi:hypothetical protein